MQQCTDILLFSCCCVFGGSKDITLSVVVQGKWKYLLMLTWLFIKVKVFHVSFCSYGMMEYKLVVVFLNPNLWSRNSDFLKPTACVVIEDGACSIQGARQIMIYWVRRAYFTKFAHLLCVAYFPHRVSSNWVVLFCTTSRCIKSCSIDWDKTVAFRDCCCSQWQQQEVPYMRRCRRMPKIVCTHVLIHFPHDNF